MKKGGSIESRPFCWSAFRLEVESKRHLDLARAADGVCDYAKGARAIVEARIRAVRVA